jgi:hypothetical protein
MANSTASIFIKPTVAFNCGDTFVFGSWVWTAHGAGSFQRRLTNAPNPKTGLVTLPEVITGDLAGKFGEISLYNQHADFESGSASNSNSTSLWAIACEPATEPSCADIPLHENFPYGLCNASRAHAEALTARRAGKEIVSDYTSNSNPASGYYSDSSYEFDFGSDPDEPEAENSTTEQPLSGPATGLLITSTPTGRFIYWPNRKPADLTGGNSHCVAYLDPLPFQEGTPLAPTEEHTPTEVATTDSGLGTPDLQVFMAAGETPGPSGTVPTGTLKISQQTSCLPMHPWMKPMMTRMPDASATGSGTNNVDVSVKPSPYGISQRHLIKSKVGCTLPLNSASCLSPR